MSSYTSPTSSSKGEEKAKSDSHNRHSPAAVSLSSSSPSPMDDSIVAALSKFLEIPRSHLTVGIASNLVRDDNEWRKLVLHRKMPQMGWSDLQIQKVLLSLSSLDTSGKSRQWCGVGEREGRVYSSLVQSRHFGFAHGVGRSGDLQESQPKAGGSTVLSKLALCMALDAIQRGAGLDASTAARHGILLPLCTGMSMALVLQSLRQKSAVGEGSHEAKNIVIWSRIDQKSCYKAIATAGYECVVLPTKRLEDQVQTDLDTLRELLEMRYRDRVAAVVTTTSCFAPRVPDAIDHVARLCSQHGIPHVINHAYGFQCLGTNKLVNRACVIGRVDAIVASTDKNFLVPVGGAIVLSPQKEVVDRVGKLYAGRASSSPVVDLFITLLSMGLDGYRQLLAERARLVPMFRSGLQEVAERQGERLLDCNNSISFGITLDKLIRPNLEEREETDAMYQQAVSSRLTRFGAMLFHRCVSGTRVVARNETKTVGGTVFRGYGSSTDEYPHSYLTAACAIGLTESEMHEFFRRLDKTFAEIKKKKY